MRGPLRRPRRRFRHPIVAGHRGKRRGTSHEDALVPPDALHGAARRLPGEASLRLGGHPLLALRPAPRAPHVQRLHRRAGIRGGVRLRRDLRQRAPLQRLRADAEPEPHRLRPRAPHHGDADLRHGQLARPLQPADAGGGGVRDDRLHQRRAADRGLPGRHADGHLLRLWTEPVDAPRALPGGARSGAARLDGAGDLRLRRAVQPAALREHLAAAGAAAASADLDSGRRLGRDLAVVRGDGLRVLLSELDFSAFRKDQAA